MSNHGSILTLYAPWFEIVSRPHLLGPDGRRPDPAAVGLQSAIINNFDLRPDQPWERAAVSVSIPAEGNPPAVGTLKLVLDAVVSAGFIAQDRDELTGVRLTRYEACDNRRRPTVDIAVLERRADQTGFVREIWPNPQPEPASPTMGLAVAYAYMSGQPDEVTFSRVAADPDEYRERLHRDWRELLARSAVTTGDTWPSLPSGGMALDVHLPESGNFDPDNVVLYLLDLIEVARDPSPSDAGVLSVDQLLNEVHISRGPGQGIRLSLAACELSTDDLTLPYFRQSQDIESGWPDPRQA